jgi:NAD(P)-dependent dehydrogenase (short-subunit alcohol dehydrogenase family)
MTGQLDGKVAVVTGGAHGIGRATVELFAKEGAKVVSGDVDNAAGSAVAERYQDVCVFEHADVTQDRDVAHLISTAVSKFGKLDIMFNNAAANIERAPLTELTPEALERSNALVVASVVAGHRHAARQFMAQGTGGSIISTSSVAGLQGGWAAGAAYTIGKHAVIGIVHAATRELASLGIRSNAIAPGVILTQVVIDRFNVPPDRADEFVQELIARASAEQPIGRVGWPEDVANAALFLASDASSYITGVVLPVDGGSTVVSSNSFPRIVAEVAAELAPSWVRSRGRATVPADRSRS